MGIVSDLVKDAFIPKMVKVRQIFPRPFLADVPGEVRKQLEQEKIVSRIKPGMRIAITAGSRGVANYAIIMREIVSFLKDHGAKPSSL